MAFSGLPSSLVLLALVLASAISFAVGHAYLANPPSRNLIAWTNEQEYCPHCLQAGGPGTVSRRGEGAWPTIGAPQSHGLCGDPVQGKDPPVSWTDETYMNADPVGQTYTAGEVVEFQIGVSTHHQGHYEFRICNKSIAHDTITSPAEGQACLNQWVLERAPPRSDCQSNDPDADCQPLDPEQPHRWFLPPRASNTQGAGPNWDDSMSPEHPSQTEVHRMRYKIPAELRCPHCTLQWYWSTGNTCLYDGLYFSYFRKMAAAGWRANEWCGSCMSGSGSCDGKCCGEASGKFGEEFWNCADIRVLAAGEQPPTESPTPAPQPTPPPANCLAAWQQCGGGSHTGPTCCVSGHYCKKIDPQYYHQCVSGVDPNPRPTPAPTASSTAAAPSPGSSTTLSPSPIGATCSCSRSTVWDGSFGRFMDGSFCSQNFGGANPYISAGGGSGTGGGHSGDEPCSSGQYSFSEESGWQISVSKSQGEGNVPYRAFAYMQFCNGSPYSTCWGPAETIRFSFSFKTQDVASIGAYVKLLFWTDAGNIVGLLPPSHPKGQSSFRLITFPQDDYPNNWANEVSIEDNTWYHLSIEFEPATRGVRISIDGTEVGSGSIPVQMLEATNGPQIGVYSFDYGASWPVSGFKLWLDDACVGETSGTCPSGGNGAPVATPALPPTVAPMATPTPAPMSAPTAAPSTAPTASPTPPSTEVPTPAPVAALTCTELCARSQVTACSASATDQTTCEQSFMVKLGFGIPCFWKPCGCFANGENILSGCACGTTPEPEPESEEEEEEEEGEEEQEEEEEGEEEEEEEGEEEEEEEESETTREPTLKPTPAPTPEPTSTEPTAAPSKCAAFCGKTNMRLQDTGCGASEDKDSCLNTYLQASDFKRGWSVPCKWAKGACKAAAGKRVDCTSYSCVESFLQVEAATSSREVRKHHFLARALLQVEQCVQTETYIEEDVLASDPVAGGPLP